METASMAQGLQVPPQGPAVRTSGWRSFFNNYKVPSLLSLDFHTPSKTTLEALCQFPEYLLKTWAFRWSEEGTVLRVPGSFSGKHREDALNGVGRQAQLPLTTHF